MGKTGQIGIRVSGIDKEFLLYCSEVDHRNLSRYLMESAVYYAREVLKIDYYKWRAKRIQEIREKGKKANPGKKDSVQNSG